VLARGYEGYVAKDEASAYEGGATRRWLKVKQKDWTVDGDDWRMLVYKDGARGRLVSRNGRDHTRRFRDIAAAISLLRCVELARCA
jgi:ATP-dependent DNA ligase